MIGILNYKMGNLQSIKNSLDYLNFSNRFVNQPEEIADCDKLILPGVGAFDLAMKELKNLGFIEPLKRFVSSGRSLLGICLGMQLLLESSEEHGHHDGLGIVKGRVLPFEGINASLSIPHVGWNNIFKIKESNILKNIEDGDNFYFVHSFYCDLFNSDEIVANTDYGIYFNSVFESGKVFGCQFHPEKSQRSGLLFLENFCKIL